MKITRVCTPCLLAQAMIEELLPYLYELWECVEDSKIKMKSYGDIDQCVHEVNKQRQINSVTRKARKIINSST